MLAGEPVKSLVVITDVAGGEIYGIADDTEHEIELAQGVTYLVIGLGKMPTGHQPGVEFVQ